MPINIDINPHFVKIRDLQVLNFLLNFASLEVGRRRTFWRIFARQSCRDYHKERKFARPTFSGLFFDLYGTEDQHTSQPHQEVQEGRKNLSRNVGMCLSD